MSLFIERKGTEKISNVNIEISERLSNDMKGS